MIEFVSLFTTLSSIIKCKSCDLNITLVNRILGEFNLVVNCKNCEPQYVQVKKVIKDTYEK